MGKAQSCRICRTEQNLKYTAKELKEFNKKQLLLAQATKQGQGNNRASKKLFLTTPTLGNICHVCEERIQIFHRLDDGGHDSNSDVEVEDNINKSLPLGFINTLPNADLLKPSQRPETPVIVDDDDMLFNIFMQKFDQKTQLPQHQRNPSYSQQQLDKQFTSQFHSTYTPPQSSGGSSEGDESKAIEVLTSRECTPISRHSLSLLNMTSNMIDQQGHRIVAIIDLDDDENEQKNDTDTQGRLSTPKSNKNNSSYSENNECRSALTSNTNINLKNASIQESCQTVDMEDDEEIIFCKVSEQEQLPQSKRRKRKSYDEKQLRLVATLNLVSSDSETEDCAAKVLKESPSSHVTEPSPLVIKKSFICNSCKLSFPDNESLSVHERIHQGVKCILCQVCFQHIKRLIHHMRHKHREYSGDALSEKPRSALDSCMTIRLRYMHHTTFYECQLCGRIDDVFREHKEHIIEKHPNESKSLKDPIMKQLKCPICKSKCGAQYLSLCRHLISSHEYQEYKTHLRELSHVSAFGWSTARQQEVAKTAKIYQFVKRKTFFFKCKICTKVVAGYLHHLRHVNEHQNSGNNEIKAKITTINKEVVPYISLATEKCNKKKLGKYIKKDRICISKKLRSHTNLKRIATQPEKVVEISEKFLKPKLKENNVQKSKFCGNVTERNPIKTKAIQSTKADSGTKNQSRENIESKKKCKPKDKEVAKLPNCVKLTKGKSNNEANKKGNKKVLEKSQKAKHIELKSQVRKVKVKAPIRQIDLQKYKCKYCFKKIKGFRLFNLHILRQHKEQEFSKCNVCNKLYSSPTTFQEHIKQCPEWRITKQKRKYSEKPVSEKLAQRFQPNLTKVPNVSSACLENNYPWLTELLKLKEPLEISDSSLNYHKSPKATLFCSQCCYCLHLFANEKDLKEHKANYHDQNPDILLRYKPLKKQ